MDKKTVKSYDEQTHEIAKIHSNLEPTRLYKLIKQYFVRGERTADYIP